MKDIQQAEFQAVQTLALNEPLYTVETQYTTNFEQFPVSKPSIQYPRQRKYFKTPKFEVHLAINLYYQF